MFKDILVGFLFTTLLTWSQAYSRPASSGIKQISEEIFTCSSSNTVVQAICTTARKVVDNELQSAGIAINANGVLFSRDDNTRRKIPTGHSCSRTAELRHAHLDAFFSRSSKLSLTGNAITDPLAIGVRAPVVLNARLDVTQRFGARIFGRCKRYASDSFSLKGSLSTIADVLVAYTLQPSLGELRSGDYLLEFKPQAAVLFKLENTQLLRLRASGVSPLSSVVSFVAGLSSSILKSVTALFKGDSFNLQGVFQSDILVPIALGVGALPKPLQDLIVSQLDALDDKNVQKLAQGIARDFERDLNLKLRKALKTGADGKRKIIVKKDIVELLRLGKGLGEILEMPVDPSGKCFAGIQQLCSSCRGCSQCQEKARKCHELRQEFLQKTTPIKTIPSSK